MRQLADSSAFVWGKNMITFKNRHWLVILACFSLTSVLCLCGCCWATSETPPADRLYVVPYYSPPRQASLCGESVPLHLPDVWERFDREFTVVVYSHAQVYLWLKRMERYFPWIEQQLAQQNLPDDLKWVAVAESDLLHNAYSPAGAAGPWQFISSTGLSYGLNQTSDIDERHDFEMATQSAFRYLKDLYNMFQNWTLAIAAYNCGEGRVRKETASQRVYDYYSLKLPLETERYVFRIVAIKEVLSHPERYGYDFPKGAGYPVIPVDQVNVRLDRALAIQSVADAAGMTYREFKLLNPAFKTDTIPPGSYNLKVNQGKGNELQARIASLQPKFEAPKDETPRFEAPREIAPKQATPKPAAPKQSIVYHKVKKGETLTGIARKYGVSTADLRDWNKMKKDGVTIGESLKIIK